MGVLDQGVMQIRTQTLCMCTDTYMDATQGCALVFASEATIEIEMKILFRL
jgi:hypothetical protein